MYNSEEQEVIQKPSLTELLWAINIEMNRYQFNEELVDEAENIIYRNSTALSQAKYSDYDQENFKKLIASIEYNGQTNFNMATFMSLLDENIRVDYVYTHEVNRSSMINDLPPVYTTDNSIFDTTTKAFNCDTVGCIAGFATALAYDWQQPKWLVGDTREYYSEMEHIACNFLNIPISFGKAIFYGDESSVWSFAKAYSNKLGGAYENLESEYDGYIDEDNWEEYSINLNSIHYKDAINLLQDVADGKILWDGDIVYINTTLL